MAGGIPRAMLGGHARMLRGHAQGPCSGACLRGMLGGHARGACSGGYDGGYYGGSSGAVL